MRPARRSRRAGVLVAAAALLLSAFGPASYADLTTASPAPPYLSGLGDRYRATSNQAWGARELTTDISSNPLNKPMGEWDPETFVWAKKCSAKAQTATFTRKLELPGPPTSTTFAISTTSVAGLYSLFKSYTLKINGFTIAKRKMTDPSPEFDASSLAKFSDGTNTVELSVKRAALPKGQKCNTSASDLLGVMFHLSGEFTGDLALVDVHPEPVYKRPGSTVQIVNISLRNLGPSAAVAGGVFILRITGVTDVLLVGPISDQIPGSYPTAPPFDDCEVTGSGASWEIRCDLAAMPSGPQVHYFSVGMRREFSSTEFSEARSYLDWQVSHPVDDDFSNNRRGAQFIWCGTLSTDPGCLALG